MTVDIRYAATGKPEDEDTETNPSIDTFFYNSKGKIVECPLNNSPIVDDAYSFCGEDECGQYASIPSSKKLICSLADTHCHIAMLPNPALSIARAAVYGVDFIVTLADPHEGPMRTYDMLDTWIDEAKKILSDSPRRDISDLSDVQMQRASEYPSFSSAKDVPKFRIACGLHPHYAHSFDDDAQKLLVQCLLDTRTCALGEIGLDYYYDYSERSVQRDVFAAQLHIADEYNLPVVLHIRQAHKDAIDILKTEGVPRAGILLHCFNMDFDVLKPFLEMDAFVAYGGALTFKKNEYVVEAAIKTPLNRILTETDAPFMAPDPLRGETCGPEHVLYTASFLTQKYCEANKIDKRVFLEALYSNAQSFLNKSR